jgi:hypothetical protein
MKIHKKKGKKKMFITLGVLISILGLIIVYFNISYSPLKSSFNKDLKELSANKVANQSNSVFTEADIENLPKALQKYFSYCGFLGKERMSYVKTYYENVDFVRGKGGSKITIDYTTYNFVYKPQRIAFIDSSMYGIPFEGYDSYIDRKGGMKGVVAKTITLFNETGAVMDQAALVTYLGECLFVPSAALQEFIQWEEIDDNHVKATITDGGLSAEGIFTFSDKGEMLEFFTKDRAVTNSDGSNEQVDWSGICNNYIEHNGIKQPSHFKAVWHYKDGDFVYFNSDNIGMEYY